MMNKRFDGALPFLTHIAFIAALLVSVVMAVIPAHPIQAAAVITPSTFQDVTNNDGKCSLREAIISANKDKSPSSGKGECVSGNGDDTIILAAGTYTLTRTDNGGEDSSLTGDLDVTANLVIQGAGADKTIIDASALTDRVFQLFNAKLTLVGVTLKGGNIKGTGGSINSAGNLTIQKSAIIGAKATSDGGGIFTALGSQLTISNSTISGNFSPNNGGGIFNGGTAVLTNTTISGNSSAVSGGAIWNSGTLTVLNTTITANTADQDANNSGEGGGLYNNSGAATFKNTILAGNQVLHASPAALDCFGQVTTGGHNLLQSAAGCTLSSSTAGDLLGQNPLLASLANNGGPTLTHAPGALSPAIDNGDTAGCPATDQRGLPRPVGSSCDIGAVEDQNPLQRSPYTVNSLADTNDGRCDFQNCTLREAILAANSRPNGSTPDRIQFNIPGTGVLTIALTSPLPDITDPLIIDATTQPNYSGSPLITVNGSQAGTAVSGFTVNTSNSQIRGLNITGFSGAGVRVLSGQGNSLTANQIYGNAALGIDLGGDGVTLNDVNDVDFGPNQLFNFPVLTRVVAGTSNTTFDGRINTAANQTVRIELFSNAACDPSRYGQGQTLLGNFTVTTDASGNALFSQTLPRTLVTGSYVTATATGSDGSTSEFSACVTASAGNDSWTHALTLTVDPVSGQPSTVSQFLDLKGQSRWYKFTIQPESRVTVTLTNLPENYDLTLYKDISKAFKDLASPQDLLRLGAEFAPDAFSPDAFSPDAFSPDAFSPSAFSPDAFSPSAFSPDAFSPDAFSPSAFSPDAFSPDAFSPDAFSPDAFSPDAFSPSAFSPDAFSPSAFSPDAFSGAQSRSLLAVSAFDGKTSEGIRVNTWDQTGSFYVRVRGRNGNFSLTAPYTLSISLASNLCRNVAPVTTAATLSPVAGNFQTLILTNMSRIPGTVDEKNALAAQLALLAARPEVSGAVIDVSADARVAAAYAQADANPSCPTAQNILADTIKEIITRYRAGNSLQYIVLVGGDNVIPFFRHADGAMLGNEKNYVPPVLDNSPSQASLKSGYFLSQDDYGASFDVSVKGDDLPIPDLAVGRLVETAAEAKTVVDAYLGTSSGVLPAPRSLLVTGYDFLTDGAQAIQSQLEAGAGIPADSLIQPRGDPPTAPSAWNAAQLSTAFLGARHDLVFLAGHFSASSTLAADYTTRLTTTDFLASTVDFTNEIIYSAGCHVAYNLINADAVPNVTPQPDWASAIASRGGTLIGGTGYQYGDTDFIEYSERLYLEFSRQLRTGQGAVPIGTALMRAKQIYLADTAVLRPIHQKALLEATLFGLPMLSVNMPGQRLTNAAQPPAVAAATPATSNPGAALGLSTADLSVVPALTLRTLVLDSVSSTGSVTATYLEGGSGTLTNPAEPVLPLERRNVSLNGTILRGVGFRGGSYTDRLNILPLTGASTTEIRGIHPPFSTNVFFPVLPWSVNYYGQLANYASGVTQLQTLPAQYLSDPTNLTTGTLRQFDSMSFRLFYNNNIQTYAGNSTPALAAAPSILSVAATGTPDQVTFKATVVANPSVGIQSVWVTYTAVNGPLYGQWQSLDLTQDPADSTRWSATLPLTATAPTDIRFMVQAVNGVGLVSLSTNIGRYFIPNLSGEPTIPADLSISIPSSGIYGTPVSVSATLTSSGQPLASQVVALRIGNQTRVGITGVDGRISADIPLLGLPGDNLVVASFAGTATYLNASASSSISIAKASTQITLSPAAVSIRLGDSAQVSAVLKAGTRLLTEKTLFLVFTSGTKVLTYPLITDYNGKVNFDLAALPFGNYTLTVYFAGQIPMNGQLVTIDDERYLASSTAGTVVIDGTPIAVADSYSLNEDTVLSVPQPGVLANDQDPTHTSMTATLVTSPAHGTLQFTADGSFSYTPAANYFGNDSFTYNAVNSAGTSAAPAAVQLTINPVNDAPVAVDDAYSLDQRTSLTVAAPGVLANDSDIDSPVLTTQLVTPPAHGTLTFNADGSFVYTPDPTYFGTDTFSYNAFDGLLASNPAVVTLTIRRGNRAPVCTQVYSSVPFLWPANGNFVSVQVLGVVDPDGDPFIINIDRIFQDEPVGSVPDGAGIGTSTALLRAKRAGNGDGRVYHVFFTATDTYGASCSGELLVPVVDHDMGNGTVTIDGGALYDSTVVTK